MLFRSQVEEFIDLDLWNNQYVPLHEGEYIQKSKEMLILRNRETGNLPGDDPGKKCHLQTNVFDPELENPRGGPDFGDLSHGLAQEALPDRRSDRNLA